MLFFDRSDSNFPGGVMTISYLVSLFPRRKQQGFWRTIMGEDPMTDSNTSPRPDTPSGDEPVLLRDLVPRRDGNVITGALLAGIAKDVRPV